MASAVRRDLRPYLIFAVAFIAAAEVGAAVKLVPNSVGDDFFVFWSAVRLDPYAMRQMPFAYPPTTLLWLQPLKLLPFWPAFILWGAVGIGAFWLAARRLWPQREVAAGLASPMVFYALAGGQFSLIVAALTFFAFSSRWRGPLLAIALTLKPQALFLAPLFLAFEKDWRGLVEMTVTGLIVAAAATFVFGPEIWTAWIGSISHLQSAVVSGDIQDYALSPSTLYRLPAPPLVAVGILFGAFMAYVSRSHSPQAKLCALAATSLLAAPYSLRYDLAIFAPFLAGIILRENWRSLVALIPFTGMLGPPSLLIVTAFAWLGKSGDDPVAEERPGLDGHICAGGLR